MPQDIVTIFKRMTERQVFDRRLHASIPMPGVEAAAGLAATLAGSEADLLRRQLRSAVGHVYLAGLGAGLGSIDTMATILAEVAAIGVANDDRTAVQRLFEMALRAAGTLQVDVRDMPHANSVENADQPAATVMVDRMVEAAMHCALAATETSQREQLLLRVMLIGTALMADVLGWNATMDALAGLQAYAGDLADEEAGGGGRWQ